MNTATRLPEELRTRIVDLVQDIQEANAAIKATETMVQEKRETLMLLAQKVGVTVGESLDVPEAGVSVGIQQTERRTLDREALLKQGIPYAIVERATTVTQSKPHIVIRQKKGG